MKLTNTELLKDKIKSSGLKQGYIAKQLHLSNPGFTNKINNRTEFKAGEIQILCHILKIKTLSEKESIFFGKEVEYNSTQKGEK